MAWSSGLSFPTFELRFYDVNSVLPMSVCIAALTHGCLVYPDIQLQSTKDILVGMGFRLCVHHCE